MNGVSVLTKEELQLRLNQVINERDRLREEVSRWRKQSDDWQTLGWKLGEENDRLKAVSAELEKTLKKAAALMNVTDCPDGGEHNRMIVAGNGIRAALSKTKEK